LSLSSVETITQATFVKGLIRYISKDPITDRDILLRGRNLSPVDADELEKIPFRNLFVGEKDVVIAGIVSNFFSAVRARWPNAWGFFGRGLILNKTNGFNALMRFLRPAYLDLAAPGASVSVASFSKLFSRIQLQDDDFTTVRFQPGTSGEAELYRTLLRDARLNE
jgi:hypothetical protein